MIVTLWHSIMNNIWSSCPRVISNNSNILCGRCFSIQRWIQAKRDEKQNENGTKDRSADLLSFDGNRENKWKFPYKKSNSQFKLNHNLPGLGKTSVSHKRPADTPDIKEEVLFGIHPVLQCLKSRRRTIHILYTRNTLLESERPANQEILETAEELGVPIHTTSRKVIDYLTQGRPNEGICCDVSKMKHQLFSSNEVIDSASSPGSPVLWLVLENVQDPMNFGAILRSSHFFGVERVFVPTKNSCALSPVVSKASAGALESSDIFALHDGIPPFLQMCEKAGWLVLGTTVWRGESQCITSIQQVKVTKNIVLVLGNEHTGVSEEVLAQCSQLVTIQPSEKASQYLDSLNVSVANGILLHQLQQLQQQQQQQLQQSY